jgi:hypothetical protein
VGNYLLVYALIARSFAQKQPAAIVAASDHLQQLQKHQDVSIERSICAYCSVKPNRQAQF